MLSKEDWMEIKAQIGKGVYQKDIAKELGVQTVAEFVEDEAIVATLSEMGVDYLQGYHIGKPSRDFQINY